MSQLEPLCLLDPTAESAATVRARRQPPGDLRAATIGLLSIGKERSAEFLDVVEERFSQQGLVIQRFAKPTHTKPAPESIVQEIVERCDVVVEALAD